MPSRPKPSSTNGNAVPSFSPPSPARLKPRRSGSEPGSDCTPDASTGSVVARTAPSSTAAPTGRASAQTPMAATSATRIAIDTKASRSGSRQRRSRRGTPSCKPTANEKSATQLRPAVRAGRPAGTDRGAGRSPRPDPGASPMPGKPSRCSAAAAPATCPPAPSSPAARRRTGTIRLMSSRHHHGTSPRY